MGERTTVYKQLLSIKKRFIKHYIVIINLNAKNINNRHGIKMSLYT